MNQLVDFILSRCEFRRLEAATEKIYLDIIKKSIMADVSFCPV